MRVASVLVMASVVLALLAVPASAIPNCDQIDNSWCSIWCDSGCSCWVTFQSCTDGTRRWRCEQFDNPPSCPGDNSGWSFCCCSECGGGCDCLQGGTPITMADGSTRPVESIRVGDRVLSRDEYTGVLRPSEVTAVHAPYLVDHYLVINETIQITGFHPMLSGGKWLGAAELSVGSSITSADGGEIQVVSIRRVDKPTTVYNFQVAAGTYVAHGIVVHNKEDCEEYMPG